MLVTSLLIYPVKSMGGLAVDTAGIEPWGIAGDRRWGLIDESGQKITAREVHGLLRLRSEVVAERTIRISVRDGASILAATPRRRRPGARQSLPPGLRTPGCRRGQRLAHRSDRHAVRLVWQEDPTVRTLAEDKGGMRGEYLSLADAGPLLLASEASMAQLNAWITADADLPDVPDLDLADLGIGTGASEALDIVRFRPNVVIVGADTWLHCPAGTTCGTAAGRYRQALQDSACGSPTGPQTLAVCVF